MGEITGGDGVLVCRRDSVQERKKQGATPCVEKGEKGGEFSQEIPGMTKMWYGTSEGDAAKEKKREGKKKTRLLGNDD